MRSISRLLDLPIVIQRAILVSAIPAAQRAAPDSLRALGALLTAQIFGQKNRRNSNDRKDKTKQPPTKSSSALFLRHQRRDNPKQSQYKEGVKEMICRKCHCTSPLTRSTRLAVRLLRNPFPLFLRDWTRPSSRRP